MTNGDLLDLISIIEDIIHEIPAVPSSEEGYTEPAISRETKAKLERLKRTALERARKLS